MAASVLVLETARAARVYIINAALLARQHYLSRSMTPLTIDAGPQLLVPLRSWQSSSRLDGGCTPPMPMRAQPGCDSDVL